MNPKEEPRQGSLLTRATGCKQSAGKACTVSILLIAAAGVNCITSTPVPVQNTTASKTTHNDMGIRRLVRINGTTLCLADGVDDSPVHEGVYRSTDNGNRWALIGGKDHCNRGTIIAGPAGQVYIFWVTPGDNPGIYLSKFHYSSRPPAATPIYEGYVTSVGYAGGYQTISAAVDLEGSIYVVAHYAPSEGEVDRIWLLKSHDGGQSWTDPRVVAYEPGTSFAHPGLEVDHSGNLILCFAHHAPGYLGGKEDDDKRIYFMKSTNQGESWGNRIQVDSPQGPFRVYNPCILEGQENNLYVFAQRASKGLVMARSTNGGSSWSGFSVIIPTSDYADASAAVGSDGTIYVTYRDDLLCGDTTPYIWRNCMAQSTDHGNTWFMMECYCGENQTGPANSLRYANWWNYGGPLEWCWEQYLNSNTNYRPVYYNIDASASIWDRIQ